ncbi:Gfo/Idh/MocA family protein [Marinilactibacillus psychrotolerans]|uniref:Gfo/Idh/MocA family oxidoreductase n=2 Tax=Marinilactibacillus psychrotolerans TaxID=191770 RepID=A0A5R9C328_9LACT|nr:Gfo/Idh/MocA family oxidoreductase [Marinilactibacillus psychrotolerans]TLQ07210.1 Gfo/Idh/MocA family oxidoreductase [Marinilactibacillus psychrotolerans]GEQ34273.1 oxidoreductase [Marinilactibacillus psychrotolerans]SJN28797.1 oxidoreductase, Gfo/Idh/MocA family [Marinilactibacillus psychrotolerans 42ea]
MSTTKWGIIGLGEIAHNFADSFKSDNAELIAVASRTLQKAQDFASEYNVPKAYGHYEALCFDPDIDIVYLATPNSHHAENIKMVLNAGKHVLCEKAIVMNAAQLAEVMELAEEKNLIVAEAMTIYHMPLFKQLKSRIQTGEFGELKMVNAMFGSLKDSDPSMRFFNKELGGGALLDIGVYALSFVRYFLSSQPTDLQTMVNLYETGVDEMSTIQLKNSQNELSTVSLSFRGKMPKQGVIVCENAFITVLDYPRADKAIITYPDGATEIVEDGSSASALSYEVQDLSDTILNKENKTYIELTKDVTDLMDQSAKAWGMDLTK